MNDTFSLGVSAGEFFFQPFDLQIALADETFERGDSLFLFGLALGAKEDMRVSFHDLLPLTDLRCVDLVCGRELCEGLVALDRVQCNQCFLMRIEYFSHNSALIIWVSLFMIALSEFASPL